MCLQINKRTLMLAYRNIWVQILAQTLRCDLPIFPVGEKKHPMHEKCTLAKVYYVDEPCTLRNPLMTNPFTFL